MDDLHHKDRGDFFLIACCPRFLPNFPLYLEIFSHLTPILTCSFSSCPNMKREGRQHGMVRSYRILPPPWNPNAQARFVNRFDSPPTAGAFTKVCSKPTNHSKFTGGCGRSRCAECHLLPACKSKGKTKGMQKMNPRDMVSNHRLITWRLVEGKPGLNFSGVSATEVLNHLSREDFDDDRYYNDEDGAEASYYDHHVEEEFEDRGWYDDAGPSGASMAEEREIEAEGIETSVGRDQSGEDNDENGFYEVGIVWEDVDGDEDWCLVQEL